MYECFARMHVCTLCACLVGACGVQKGTRSSGSSGKHGCQLPTSWVLGTGTKPESSVRRANKCTQPRIHLSITHLFIYLLFKILFLPGVVVLVFNPSIPEAERTLLVWEHLRLYSKFLVSWSETLWMTGRGGRGGSGIGTVLAAALKISFPNMKQNLEGTLEPLVVIASFQSGCQY